MITVQQYRKKVQAKKRKLRNWVFIIILFTLSVIFVNVFVNLFTSKTTIIMDNATYKDNEILVNLTEIDLNDKTPEIVIKRIEELQKITPSTNVKVKIFLDSKIIAHYSINSPEISILNAKGENNLAMETSIKLIKHGFNIKNYGNYVSNTEKSIILNRTSKHDTLKKLSEVLKITNISNFVFEESLKDNLSGIIVILGKDYKK